MGLPDMVINLVYVLLWKCTGPPVEKCTAPKMFVGAVQGERMGLAKYFNNRLKGDFICPIANRC